MKVTEMDSDLFLQRRRVIKMIHEAHEVLKMDLPRLKVRVVDFEKESHVLGRCFIRKNYITISQEMNHWSDNFLRHIVWHELAPAYFNAEHDEKCPLMDPIMRDEYSRVVLVKALKRCARR